MQSIFDMRDGHSYPFQEGLPAGYRGTILQGSVALSAQTPSGLVILQNYQGAGFAIQLGIYKFLHLVHCILKPPVFDTGSVIALQHDLKCRMPEIGSIGLNQGQFSFLKYGGEYMYADLKANREYQILEISSSDEWLSPNLVLFPGLLKEFKTANDKSLPSLLSHPLSAGRGVLSIADELLNSHYTREANEIFFEDRVRDYIFLLMVEASKKPEPRVYLSKETKERFIQLRARLMNDSKAKFPIHKLAQEMGMNDMTFKLAFKEIFHKAPFEFHLDQRMKQAQQLLKESGLPIKVISSMVGYDRPTSFITKFREYYDYPPSRLQKKK